MSEEVSSRVLPSIWIRNELSHQAWWQVPFPLSYLSGPKKSFLVKTSNGDVTNVLFFHTRLLFLTRKLQPKLKILEHLSSLGFKSLAVVGVFTLWGSLLF